MISERASSFAIAMAMPMRIRSNRSELGSTRVNLRTSGKASQLISDVVRPTSITYSSAFENADYRAANRCTQAAVSAVVCLTTASRKTAL